MKKVLLFGFFCCTFFATQAQVINEFHYDNINSDANEFIEVLLPTGADPADFAVSLYNGNGGTVYATHQLTTFTAGDTDINGTYYFKNISGIQNGNPDGIALSENGVLTEFLSYEGTFTASGGPADGVLSTDIGVAESNSTTTSTESLQRSDDGSWFGPTGNTQGGANDAAAPINLAFFTAKPMDSKTVSLDWATASEENNEYFSIEHSIDGRDFTAIDEVEGAINSTEMLHYSYEHKETNRGINYYRLRQVDTDGTFSFSPIEAVTLESNIEFGVRPTVVESNVTLEIAEAFNTEATIEVYNVLGRLVASEVLASGAVQRNLNVSDLQSGHYFIRLINGSEYQTTRFIKR